MQDVFFWIEVFATVTGVLYLVWEIGQKNLMWVVGIATGAACAFSFGLRRIYASMSLNLYYVVVSFWGLYQWRKDQRLLAARRGAGKEAGTCGQDPVNGEVATGTSGCGQAERDEIAGTAGVAGTVGTAGSYVHGPAQGEEEAGTSDCGQAERGETAGTAEICGQAENGEAAGKAVGDSAPAGGIHLNRPGPKVLYGSAFAFLAGTAGLYFLLAAAGGSMTLLDSATTMMSVIGTLWLAKSYPQQWFVWMAADTLSALLCLKAGMYWMAALYLAYTLGAVYGLVHWRRHGCYVGGPPEKTK